MKKALLFLTILFIASCSKKDVDVRDQYVGTWKFERTGGVNTFINGQIAESIPLDGDGTVTISKSGENGLLIDKKEFLLDGDQLTSDPEEVEFNTPQQAHIVATADITSGTIKANSITHTSSLVGTWTYGSSRGPVSGQVVVTMKK